LKQLNIITYEAIEDLERNKRSWDEAVSLLGGDIYYYCDWLLTWLQHYGKGNEIRCFLVYDKERLVGALPFIINDMGIPGFKAKIARLIGCHSCISVFRLPIKQGCEFSVLKSVVDQLMVNDFCDSVIVSNVEKRDVWGDLNAVNCSKASVLQETVGLCTRFELSKDFDEYLKRFSRKRRQKIRYERKQLETVSDLKIQVLEKDQCIAAFDKFVCLHTEQWKLQNQRGHFGEWKGSIEFNRDLIRKFAKSNMVKMYCLLDGPNVISMSYCYQTSTTSHNRLTARAVEPRFEKLGIGKVAYIRVLEKLMNEGISEEETGPGHYDYKVSLGATEHPMMRISFIREDLSSQLKSKVAMDFFKLLNFLYYRVWFLKISKKFFGGTGALWPYWSRNKL